MPMAELYHRQVGLLVKVIPLVAAEACFALKGGTAINLLGALLETAPGNYPRSLSLICTSSAKEFARIFCMM